MIYGMSELPRWEEREEPNVKLLDIGEPEIKLTMSRHNMAQNFVDWVNDFRQPLHENFVRLSEETELRLVEAGIDHASYAQAVAEQTGTKPYALHRTVFHDQALDVDAYREAAGLNFFPEDMTNPDGTPGFAQFYAPFSFIRLNPDYFESAELYSKRHTYLHILGRAAMGSIVDAVIPEGDNPRPYTWYGYSWRYDGQDYGTLLDLAAGTKLAALAAEELGVRPQYGEEVPEPLRPYLLPEGFYFDAGAAIMLDTISDKAGADIHRPIREFAKHGRDERAREEAAAILAKATGGQVKLEELEAAPVAYEGLPIRLMQKVEEACGLASNRRPSVALLDSGVTIAD
jgi:hypothetical protein